MAEETDDAEHQVPTTAKAWKQRSEATDLKVPSGNVCLARMADMRSLMQSGQIPNPLMPIVSQALKSGKEPDLKKMATDPKKIQSVLELIDNVVISVVVEPKVLPLPREENPQDEKYDKDFERDEDDLYVDQVAFDDKIFVFQWAIGGTRDLERFRAEFAQSLDNLPISQDMVDTAKQLAGLA